MEAVKTKEVRTPEKKVLIGVKCDINGRKALVVSHKGKKDIIFVEDLMKSLFS
jgi:hypothetical protein